MQEEAQVGWHPVYVTHTLSWEAKFLILYLLVVLGIWLVKSGRLTRQFGRYQRRSGIPFGKLLLRVKT
jgi:hypothetical protein